MQIQQIRLVKPNQENSEEKPSPLTLKQVEAKLREEALAFRQRRESSGRAMLHALFAS